MKTTTKILPVSQCRNTTSGLEEKTLFCANSFTSANKLPVSILSVVQFIMKSNNFLFVCNSLSSKISCGLGAAAQGEPWQDLILKFLENTFPQI